jgi:hypothetical protein
MNFQRHLKHAQSITLDLDHGAQFERSNAATNFSWRKYDSEFGIALFKIDQHVETCISTQSRAFF